VKTNNQIYNLGLTNPILLWTKSNFKIFS
jgi:hypothetical protein